MARHKVRYLVVGGYAVMKYTEPRFTKDLDLWIATDPENAEAVFAALKEFGAPLKDLAPTDFTQEGYFYQMGAPPFRLDIMMSVPGVTFEAAWANREETQVEGLAIPFISKADLIKTKEASGRDQDQLDVKKLRRTSN
ncbi:MAG: hypothetical protein JW955_05505 [Sedimentisphaerales bacterium]|nr:hypothetical protein [Sedimentisphaerales bacterium]